MKKILYITASLLIMASCSTTSKGEGQVIYHWEKERTGIEKFARDHNECMKIGERMRFMPNFKSWMYSEESRLDIRANWHSERGVWASYIAYPGAQPIIINSLHRNEDINPKKYRLCMEDRGYWHRTYDIPTISNIYVYKPQVISKDLIFEGTEL